MRRATNPREEQRIATSGSNGTGSLDLGGRGRQTQVQGFLYGTLAADLNMAEVTFESYIDGQLYILVDQFSNAWPNVKLVSFEPQGKVNYDAKWGYCRPYTATFAHMT